MTLMTMRMVRIVTNLTMAIVGIKVMIAVGLSTLRCTGRVWHVLLKVQGLGFGVWDFWAFGFSPQTRRLGIFWPDLGLWLRRWRDSSFQGSGASKGRMKVGGVIPN